MTSLHVTTAAPRPGRVVDLSRVMPVVMSGEEVRAVLEDRKTQLRWILKEAPGNAIETVPSQLAHAGDLWDFRLPLDNPVVIRTPCRVKDTLWVRETWRFYESARHDPWPDLPSRQGPRGRAFYREGFDRSSPARWLSPQIMPQWASRITLQVTDVRVQRLQEISELDARAEGVRWTHAAIVFQTGDQDGRGCKISRELSATARGAFACRWDGRCGRRRRREVRVLGDPGYSPWSPWRSVIDTSAAWINNPWVAAVTFRRTS